MFKLSGKIEQLATIEKVQLPVRCSDRKLFYFLEYNKIYHNHIIPYCRLHHYSDDVPFIISCHSQN